LPHFATREAKDSGAALGQITVASAIVAADFSFLKKNSWIDCSTCVGIDAEELLIQIAPKTESRVVHAPPLRLLAQVIRALEESKTMPTRQRDWILASLRDAVTAKTIDQRWAVALRFTVAACVRPNVAG
jgi:hypothetical protein